MANFMNVKEVAAYTHFAPQTIYNLVFTKKIPFERISPRKVLFDKDEIDRWLLERAGSPKVDENDPPYSEKASWIFENIGTSSKERSKKHWAFKDLILKKASYAAALVLMFLAGSLATLYYFRFQKGTLPQDPKSISNKWIEYSKNDLLQDGSDIQYIRVIPTYFDKDEVKIRLGHLSDVEFQGQARSDSIMPFLLYVLQSEKEDYATKSKTIDVVKPYLDDENIRKALIQVMKSDKNPSIRMKALAILSKSTQTKEIKDAILDRLLNDGDETLRFRSLEALEKVLDAQILSALLRVKKEDSSETVRNRADILCQEAQKKMASRKI